MKKIRYKIKRQKKVFDFLTTGFSDRNREHIIIAICAGAGMGGQLLSPPHLTCPGISYPDKRNSPEPRFTQLLRKFRDNNVGVVIQTVGGSKQCSHFLPGIITVG